jgi:hypothetical protein
LKINTSTGVGTVFGSVSGSDKWRDIVYASGKLWLIPNGEPLRVIDPTTDTISSSLGGTTGYGAGVLASDGHVYAVHGTRVLDIDPSLASAGGGVGQTVTNYTPLSATAYSGFVEVASLSRIYGIPSGSGSGQQVLRVDFIPPPAPPSIEAWTTGFAWSES